MLIQSLSVNIGFLLVFPMYLPPIPTPRIRIDEDRRWSPGNVTHPGNVHHPHPQVRMDQDCRELPNDVPRGRLRFDYDSSAFISDRWPPCWHLFHKSYGFLVNFVGDGYRVSESYHEYRVVDPYLTDTGFIVSRVLVLCRIYRVWDQCMIYSPHRPRVYSFQGAGFVYDYRVWDQCMIYSPHRPRVYSFDVFSCGCSGCWICWMLSHTLHICGVYH